MFTRPYSPQDTPRITPRDHAHQITTLPSFHPAKSPLRPVRNSVSRKFQQKTRRRSPYTTRRLSHVTRLYPLQDTPRITPRTHLRQITILPRSHPAKASFKPVSNLISPQISAETPRKKTLHYPQFIARHPPLSASRHSKNHPKRPPTPDNDTAKLSPGTTAVITSF